MFQLGKALVSEDILKKEFVCNLEACKGACCVEGEAGAPVEEDETKILEELYSKVKPYLRPEGIQAIESQGTFVKGEDGDWETPLVNGKECAYAQFDEKGTARCGIEDAYNEGVIHFRKPISCHLYPVRIREYAEFTAVNYHHWPICDDACILGKNLGVPTYVFVKNALIRKFGEEWYAELEQIASEMEENRENKK